MQDNEKKPALRFKGFTDPWEQRKFSELYEKVSRKNDLTYGKDDIISVANMYYKAESYITDENYLLTYNVFEMGDIAFEGNKSKNFAHGRFVENTIGNGIVSHVFDVFKPRMTNYDLQFWKYAINNERIMGPILLRSTKASTMMTNLVADDFLQENFLIPCYEEQKKIGEFLNQLDTLITLHQRKYERLVNIKKSMLDKMFPQNGASVPEIRFKGFTDPWEQRKLGEVGSVAMCRRIFKEQTAETGDVPFYKIGTFGGEADAFISKDLFEEYKVKYPYPQKGDILLSASGSIGRNVEFTGKNEYFQDSNIVWLKHNEQITNDFLKCFYSVVQWSGIEGSTIKRLYNENILNTVIKMPSILEQQKVGKFFQKLDILITLHQRKLEKLQNIKKSCLEKMFV